MSPFSNARLRLWCALLIGGVSLSASGRVEAQDLFERHTSRFLTSLKESQKPLAGLNLSQAGKLKPVDARQEGQTLVVETDEGGLAKLQVAFAFRKGAEKPYPVLFVSRYVTYRTGDTTSAAGKDVMLFPGFRFNLDLGQVVPEGEGEDLVFTPAGELKGVGKAKLYAWESSQLPAPEPGTKKHNPLDHVGVVAEDWAGTWKVQLDGRWSGTWQLELDDDGNIVGEYTSAETKSTYPITGKPTAQPHHAKLTVQLANTTQSVDAYLWTKDKAAMAGTANLAGRTFGFYAVRHAEK